MSQMPPLRSGGIFSSHPSRHIRLMTNRLASHVHGIDIVPFRAEHARDFYALNRAWLDEHELYEPADEAQLTDPAASIIAHGGRVFIAVEGDVVVGTAAVTPHGHGEMQIVKLTVGECARGKGLGRALVEACLAFARQHGAERAVLISSTRLRAALRLYEAMGFVHRPMPADVPYASADVFMELALVAQREPGAHMAS